MRNEEGDFDPAELIFVDFDLTAYGARAFDLNYHMSYWLPDWGKLLTTCESQVMNSNL